MVRVSEDKSDCSWARRSWIMYTLFQIYIVEFKKPSQTATERGKAELRILDFKNTWSDFQNTTAAEWSQAEPRLYNLKETSPLLSWSQAVVCVSTPRMYPRSGYFLVTSNNNFRNSWSFSMGGSCALLGNFLHLIKLFEIHNFFWSRVKLEILVITFWVWYLIQETFSNFLVNEFLMSV